MRKLSILLAAVFLAVACAVCVHAADTAVIGMSSVETKVGTDRVTLTVSADKTVLAKSLYIGDFSYDTGLLRLESGEWLLSDAVMYDFSADLGDGVAAFDSNTEISGDLFRLTFRVLADYATSIPVQFQLDIRVKEDSGNEILLPGVKCNPGLVTVTDDPVYLGMEQKTVKASEGTFSIDVKITQEADVKSIMIQPKDDIAGLELIGGEWLISGKTKSNWSAAKKEASITFASNTKVSGPVFRITYRILDTAEGDIEIPLEKLAVKRYSEVLKAECGLMWDCGAGMVTVERVTRGDVNGDTFVNSDDAIYLLRHTMNNSRYPINQSGDMNGDSFINSDDAIYLLRHTMNGSRYPLY